MAVFPPYYQIPTAASSSGCCSYFVDDSSTAWDTGTPPTAPSNAPASPNNGDTAIEKKSNGVAYWTFDGTAWALDFWCPTGSSTTVVDEVCVSEDAPAANSNPAKCKIWVHCNPNGTLNDIYYWCDPNWIGTPVDCVASTSVSPHDTHNNPNLPTDTFVIPSEWLKAGCSVCIEMFRREAVPSYANGYLFPHFAINGTAFPAPAASTTVVQPRFIAAQRLGLPTELWQKIILKNIGTDTSPLIEIFGLDTSSNNSNDVSGNSYAAAPIPVVAATSYTITHWYELSGSTLNSPVTLDRKSIAYKAKCC